MQELIDPPIATDELPGIGGCLRASPEDFRVDEVPAYEPDGRAGHLFVAVTKRGWNTADVARDIAHHCGIDRAEIGVAGLKDRNAVTTQILSIPERAGPALATFQREGVVLGPPRAHGHKLRRGHLRGNRFAVVVRDLAVSPDAALERVAAKLDALAGRGGLDNLFGAQRFGRDGANLERGLQALREGPRARRGDLVVSAGQAAGFNHYLLARRAAGLMQTVVEGDILKKCETGGMFESEAPEVDQARLDAGELVVTGPMFGGRMRAPRPDTAAAEQERHTLQALQIDAAAVTKLGKKVPGTRRPILVQVSDVSVQPVAPDRSGGPGVRVCFFLPAGSYATQLCRELMLGS